MRTYAVACALVALAGCAALPPPPLHAAWYLQYTACKSSSNEPATCMQDAKPGSSKEAQGVFKLYVALLNRSEWDIAVDEVSINPGAAPSGGRWRWVATDHSFPAGLRLPIGKLVTLPFDQFAVKEADRGGDVDRSCVLPVEITVMLATNPADPRPWHERWYGRAQGDSPGTIRAELAGRMPSSLPDDWAKRCQPSPGASNAR